MSSAEISYGKIEVPVQRIGFAPLRGLPQIPESQITELDGRLLVCEVSMEVLGDAFIASYTEGDNSKVVATDTMKNVILEHALDYGGATMEGLLHSLGTHFLDRYEDMDGLKLTAHEVPFAAATEKVFFLREGDYAVARLQLAKDGTIVSAEGAQVQMKLLKTTGSAFTRFARDGSTTLPERGDRPLYIYLDVGWTYADPVDALAGDPSRYVAPAQVRDVLLAVHEELVSESIQQLEYVMGERVLERFPALASVWFEGQNHTHDPLHPADTPDGAPKAYTAPFPAWGLIKLTLTR